MRRGRTGPGGASSSSLPLSGRMDRLASLVTEGNRLADVGTDHAYIPIALALTGRIPSALAMDVNRGPLARAQEHIRNYGLSTYIKTRLSDGLTGLMAGEADTVLIAGLGGHLTVRILSGGAHCLDTVEELILQPQSEICLVREWLAGHGFRIALEDIVKDEGKYYPMLRAVHGEEVPLDGAEFFYGAVKRQSSPRILEEYLEKELAAAERILEILRQSSQEGSARFHEKKEARGRIVHTLEKLRGQENE